MAILFHRGGHSPWLILLPIANVLIMLELSGCEGWVLLLFFIPFGGLVASWMICSGLAAANGRGSGFAVGLYFLPWVFYPLLVFTV